ncbi:hypothetical protein ACFL6I_19575 [candidate division KSB1 bacterium]
MSNVEHIDTTFSMGDTVKLLLQEKKKGTSHFFVIGGKNGEINRTIDYRFALGVASLIERGENSHPHYLIMVSDPDYDGIVESTMNVAFEPQQTIVVLEGLLNGSAEHYMSKIRQEYENKSRARFSYADVGEEFFIEGRIVNENNGIMRLINPIHFDFYGCADVPDITPFKTGFIKRSGLVVSNSLFDISEIELELRGNYDMEMEENAEKTHGRTRGHLRVIK